MTARHKTLAGITLLTVVLGAVLLRQQRTRSNTPSPEAVRTSIAANQTSEFPQAAWKFAGYGEPEAGYQTFMWAMSQGNIDTTLDSLTPVARARWEKNMTKPRAEIAAQWTSRTKQTELFRILDKQSVSDTETHLQIESVGASNENPVQEQWAKMIKVGSDWKFEGWVGN